MEAKGCPVNVSPKLVTKYVNQIAWSALFRDDAVANGILGKWMTLLDSRDTEIFAKMQDQSYKLMKELSTEDKKLLINDIRSIANQISNESANLIGSPLPVNQTRRISDELRIKKVSDDIVNNVKYIEDLFMNNGYAPYKIFQTLNFNTGLVDIYNNINGSLKYAFILQDGVNTNNVSDRLINFGKTRGMNEKTAIRFKEDMLGEPLLSKERGHWIGSLKSAYSFLKYSPVTGLVTGSLLLANNTLLGTTLLLSKRRGLEGLLKSDGIDFLLKEQSFLKSETRVADTINNWYDQDGKNFFNRIIEKTFSAFPDNAVGNRLRTFFQGGVHNIRDMCIESTVKRQAIAESLAKNGIDVNNIDWFIKNIKEGNIDPKFLEKLRADTMLNWKSFFTVGGISSLNRNRFSKRWVINTLQNYVINRADDVWSGIKKFATDMKANPKRTRGEFSDYLMNENQELKSLLNNILLSAKLGIYIDAMTEGHDGEDREKRVWKYVMNMSDYLSSLRSTFFFRIFTAPVNGLNSYYQYTKATGQPEQFTEGVQSSMLYTLSEITGQLFREGKILNILTDSALAFLKTGNIDFTKDVADIDLKKITDGMGRFSLLPGYDSFGQKGVESPDDMIGRILFEYPEFNQAAGKLERIRDIGQIESMLNDTGRATMNILYRLPLISSFYKASSSNPSGQFSEASLKAFMNEVDNNPVMQEIWNGKFPEQILNYDNITNNLYSELTAHSYYGKKLGKDGEHLVSEYGLTKEEEKVFVDNIAEGLGISTEDLGKILSSNKDKSYIVKALAAAEASKPGSSKIVLGYLANDMLYNMKKSIYGNKFTNSEVDELTENNLRKEVVKDLYPYMYFADKTAWYKLAREYIGTTKPDILGNLKSDSELTGFVNTLGFMDLLYWNEAKQGDVDAGYIKNIFNISAKYIKNPELRTKLVTNSLNTISGLESATQSQKQLMRIGVLAANINHYSNIKRDPIASAVYKEDLNVFENTIRGVMKNLNDVGIEGMESKMNDLSTQQYYGSTYKRYTPNKSYKSNSGTIKQVRDGFNNIYKPEINGRPVIEKIKPNPIIEGKRISIPEPKEYNLYYRVYNETYKAVSEDITKQSGRKYPAEGIEGLKFNKPSYRKTKSYKSKGMTIPRTRKKYPSKATRKDLPGG